MRDDYENQISMCKPTEQVQDAECCLLVSHDHPGGRLRRRYPSHADRPDRDRVETVPVEVTRVVEVVNTVEVTRQVLVTVVVEVPVTPEATPTATRPPAQPASTISYLPTPTALVQAFEPQSRQASRG